MVTKKNKTRKYNLNEIKKIEKAMKEGFEQAVKFLKKERNKENNLQFN